MLATTRSQEANSHDTTMTNMEGRLLALEEQMLKMRVENENLQRENEVLQGMNAQNDEDNMPS